MNKYLTVAKNSMIVLSVAGIYYGFRLVTQAGLEGYAGTVQNDGFAMSGGILLLLSGITLGILIGSEVIKYGKKK